MADLKEQWGEMVQINKFERSLNESYAFGDDEKHNEFVRLYNKSQAWATKGNTIACGSDEYLSRWKSFLARAASNDSNSK